MSKRKPDKRKRLATSAKGSRRKIATIVVMLALIAAGVTAASWSVIKSRSAEPQSQPSLAKEYIYAGGRLVATEEMAPSGPAAPSINSPLSPDSATQGSSFTLTITGSNLSNTSSVNFIPPADITVSNISSTSTQVTASVSITGSAATGNRTVSVTTPGGTSNTLLFTVNTQSSNPVPSISNISPQSVTAGSPTFTLTVNGSNFMSTSVVQVNNSNRQTTPDGANQVTAQILASDVAVAGSLQITVVNPAPGGGPSNPATLTVTGTGGSWFSLLLNGTNAYVNVANSSTLNITGPFTVEAWINATTPTATQQCIVERYKWTSIEDGGFAFRLQSGKLQLWTIRSNTSFDVVQGNSVISAGWHHVAGVWDGNELRVYLDGVLNGAKTSTLAPASGTADLKIGARGDNASSLFNGLIDEARVTASVVYTSNFTLQTHLSVVSGTKGLWKFDDQTANDTSCNGNNGSLILGATFSTNAP